MDKLNMNTLNKQRGVTFWQILVLAPLIGFYFFLGIKLGPEYLNFNNVRNAVDGVANEARTSKPSKQEMRTGIRKRLSANYVEFLTNENITIKDKKDGTHITAQYEREVPIAANVFVTLKFKHESKVKDHSSI